MYLNSIYSNVQSILETLVHHYQTNWYINNHESICSQLVSKITKHDSKLEKQYPKLEKWLDYVHHPIQST